MITFPTRTLTNLLFACALVLAVTSFALQLVLWWSGWNVNGLAPLFNVEFEQNVPSWFASMLHLLTSIACFLTSALVKRSRRKHLAHWLLLGFVFCYFSLDEAATIHETLSHDIFQGAPVFWRWIIPGVLLVSAVSWILLPFIKSLPITTSRQMTLGWCVFFGSALGVESLQHMVVYFSSEQSLMFALCASIEECGEMCGVILILRAILVYIGDEFGEVRLNFSADPTEDLPLPKHHKVG